MTDPSGLSPEQEAVRRLLADARHDGPTPPEVVSRLDERLAALVAERGPSPLESVSPQEHVAPVVDLGARRRRLAGMGVLAAAAVVVAGVALGQALPRGAGDAQGGDAASRAESTPSGDEASPDEDSQSDDSGAGATELAPEAMRTGASTPYADQPALSAADPELDERVLELRPGASARPQGLGSLDALSSCRLLRLGQGRRLLVQVDGGPGIVVFRRPDGATQEADIYACGGTGPVRTITLPAP